MAERDIDQVKQGAQQRLLAIPGVVGVGVGPKMTGCRHTGQVAIVVFVERKLALEDVPLDQRIPEEIEGIKTDVVQSGRAVLAEDPDPKPAYVDRRRFRAKKFGLRGGIQLALEESGGYPTYGTLGCIVTRNTPQGQLVYALTCAHVANEIDPSNTALTFKQQAERTGHTLGQPTPGGSDCSGCCTDIVGSVVAARFDLLVDGAIIRLTPGLPWAADVHDLGPMHGARTLVAADMANEIVVRKRGRTTLMTRGVVRAVNQAGNSTAPGGIVVRTYDGQIAVSPLPPFKAFILSGDSGSALLDAQRNVVGVLHSEIAIELSSGELVVANGVASPIAEVLSGFQVEIPTATTANVVNTVPEVAVAGAVPLPVPRPASVALERAQLEMDRTALGRRYLELFERHAEEVRDLITRERRVAAIWRRRKGEALGSRIMSAVYYPTRPIFTDDEPNLQGLFDVLDALERYGSSELQTDVRAVRPDLARWGHLSYAAILSEMTAADARSTAQEAVTS